MNQSNEPEEPLVGSLEWRHNEIKRTLRIMGELCGYREPTSPVFGEAHDFGQGHFVFTQEMPDFIWRTNLLHKPTALFPYSDVMHRWYLLNSLLVLKEPTRPDNLKALYHDPGYFVADNSELLATMLSFALIEELSFRITQQWNERGIVGQLINNPRLRSDSGEHRTYEPGSRISHFHHKLILLEEALPSVLRFSLAEMNKALEGWGTIAGIHQPPRDLYTRLTDQRNRLAHGAKSGGWEGWLVSLLVNCIYLSFDQNFQDVQQPHGTA